MSARDLLVVYLLVGLPLGLLAFRRGGRHPVVSLLGTALLWPLWAPFSVPGKASSRRRGASSDRVERALSAAEDAARRSGFTPVPLDKVRAAAERLSQRILELDDALAESRGRRDAEPGPGTEAEQRAVARLERLREESVAALDGLVSLVSALTTSLRLSRFEAENGGELDDIVAQLKAHLEVLGEASRC